MHYNPEFEMAIGAIIILGLLFCLGLWAKPNKPDYETEEYRADGTKVRWWQTWYNENDQKREGSKRDHSS